MLQWLNLQPEVFGIDVNDLSLKIVKLRKKLKGFSMVSFHEVLIKQGIVREGVIQDQQALARVIRSAVASVKGKKITTPYVIVSLPEEKSFSQVIQMPQMSYEELKTAVPYEAENYIPLPIDKVYLDFEVIGEAAKSHSATHIDVLVNVIPKPIVDAYVATFKAAGLTPCVLEVESEAVTRALIKRGDTPNPMLLIDLGNASTTLIIFSSGAIRFTSSIPVSSQQLTQAIAKEFSISESKAEDMKIKYGLIPKKTSRISEPVSLVEAMNPVLVELAEQIKKYITFYRDHISNELVESAGSIQKILLCGGGANLKGLPEFLTKRLSLPVEVANPFINLVSSPSQETTWLSLSKALSFTTALGLAMRGADQKANRIYD